MTYVLPYPEFCSGCFAKFELSVVKWHESRHFSFVCDRFCLSFAFYSIHIFKSCFRRCQLLWKSAFVCGQIVSI